MTKTTLAAALMIAALLTSPAVGRQAQSSSHRFIANARNMTIARSAERQTQLRIGITEMPVLAERDVWGHWGAYYGPMVHVH
jgi:hypothetical protein